MKKLLVVILLILPMAVMGQVKKGFFDKVGGTAVEKTREEGATSSNWYIRPTAQLSAISLIYNKDTKQFESIAFKAAGIGIGYQHYVEQNGVLVNNYGVNGLVIVNSPENEQVGFGLAATVNALGFVNVGGGRDFTNKKWLILIGASYSF